MMKPFIHAAAILAISLLAAATTWWVAGPPNKGCKPETLKPGEICIQSIPSGKEMVWIDARSRSEWKRNGLPGSILWNLEREEDANTMESEAVMKIFNTPYVIVYCGDKGCGTSKKIAQRIHDLELGAEVHVLHGGWQALKDAGLVK